MMKKRIISFALAVVMVVSLLPVSVFAMKTDVKITEQPKSMTVRPGETVTLKVSATGGKDDYLYYAWIDEDLTPIDMLVDMLADCEDTDNLFGHVKGTVNAKTVVAKKGLELISYYSKHPEIEKALFDGAMEPNLPSSEYTFTANESKNIRCVAITSNVADLDALAKSAETLDPTNLIALTKFVSDLDVRITGYAMTDVISITVDTDAPCLDHPDGEVTRIKDPTCTENGIDGYICPVCGHTVVVTEIPSRGGHDFGDWAAQVEATCTESGTDIRFCSHCDAIETRGVKALGHDYKNGVCERCGAKAAKPKTPTVTLSVVTSSGKIKLSWKAVDGAAKYEVYRATSSDGTYKKLTTTTKTSYTNTSATAGTKYYYKVRAVSAEGAVGSYSKVVSKICDLAQPVVTLSNVASSGKIKVSWDKVTNASKYEVYRATSSSGTYKKLTSTTKTSYTDTSAKAGTKYYYKVKAICSKTSDGNSAYSAVVNRICDVARPTAKIALSSGHPKVTWAKIDGASKYEVYRATSKSGTYTKLTTTSSASYTDKKAKAGKTYYYKVKAVCSKTTNGNSAYSSVVSIKAK